MASNPRPATRKRIYLKSHKSRHFSGIRQPVVRYSDSGQQRDAIASGKIEIGREYSSELLCVMVVMMH
jgi:hypothetical protein